MKAISTWVSEGAFLYRPSAKGPLDGPPVPWLAWSGLLTRAKQEAFSKLEFRMADGAKSPG